MDTAEEAATFEPNSECTTGDIAIDINVGSVDSCLCCVKN